MVSKIQEWLDRFYFANGPCCAGCDWWQHFEAPVGDCTKSAPVPGHERWALLGIDWISKPMGAGHVVTHHNHVCGDFKDDFDWTALPLTYRKKVGELDHRKALLDEPHGREARD